MASSTSRESFESVFPSLVQDLLDHAKKYNLPENALQWFEKVHSDTKYERELFANGVLFVL